MANLKMDSIELPQSLPLTPPLSPPIVSSTNSPFVPDHEYKLARGGRESIRLTAQHYILQARQGWLLHPQIAQSIQTISRPQIADIATGTGIWAMDVARQYPHANVVGLDISDKQFLPKWTLGPNMTLGLGDVLGEVPAEYRGRFDVVHVRLLLCAGPAVDKQIFINYFRTLLKPGGWLQWDDLSFPNLCACYPSEQEPSGVRTVLLEDHPLTTIKDKFFGMRKKAGWFTQFETVMTEEAGGFEDVHHLAVPVRPHLLQMESDLSVAVVTELFEIFMRDPRSKDPTTLAKVRSAVAKVHADAADGVLFAYAWNVGIAKKSQ